MTDHERLKEIFTHALSIRVLEERSVYLAGVCHGDSALREQVESLLAAAEQIAHFIKFAIVALTEDASFSQLPGWIIG